MRSIAMWLSSLILAAAIAVGAAAQTGDGSEGTAIRDIIRSQLAAFNADDAGGAYRFASPKIQALFPTPEKFAAMVRRAYPQIYRSQDVEFGPLREIGGGWTQQVTITGQDGTLAGALYRLIRLESGEWRIDGVVIAKLAGETI